MNRIADEIVDLRIWPLEASDRWGVRYQFKSGYVHVAPSGRFLYGSNRGHDSLVVYKIDEKTGKLEYVEHTLTGGKTPRNFTIAPNGKFLLAANQNSDSIIVFKVDEKSGKLTKTGNNATVSMPVCLQ